MPTRDRPSSGAGGSDWNSWANHVLIGMEDLQKSVRKNCVDTLEQKDKVIERIEAVKDGLSKDISITRDLLSKDILSIRDDVTALKIKAGVWGALGGAIPVAIGLLIWGLKSLS